MNVMDQSLQTTNVLIVGVGGQGVIMISKVLARLCQLHGYQVKQSEVHGMAKRGGSVFSHVRFGPQVWSPTIPKGKVDILVALEWAEGLRWLPHLNRKQGSFIADTRQIIPPFACLDRSHGAQRRYSAETPSEIMERVDSGYALDATTMAAQLGNLRAANTVLLGALSATLDFPVELWQSVIAEAVPPKTVEINRLAFFEGRGWVERARALAQDGRSVAMPDPPPPMLPGDEDDFELRITPAWCKGCDICVKMCPERCLVLNAEQIVELARPEACTGCRICEWLCPDFAIEVLRPNAAPVSD
jgi:indolepyruvate ferredoxin oxidoreductase beta subunit